MIISHPTHVEEAVMCQIFSYFANNATGVSQIVVHVKYIIGELELIAVKRAQLKNPQLLQVNAEGQQSKELDARTEQLIQMAVAIYTKFYKIF